MTKKEENFTALKDYYFIDCLKDPRLVKIRQGKIIDVKPYKEEDLGKVYLGQVDYKLENLSAYFVRLGKKKRGFLQEDIQLEKNQPILVQVNKEAYGQKAPGLTTEIALQGDFLVHFPKEDFLKYSNKDKKALKKAWQEAKHKLPKGGWLIRTGAFALDLALEEAKDLYKEGQKLLQEEKLSPKVKLLYEKESLDPSLPVFTNNKDLAQDKDYTLIADSLYFKEAYRHTLEDLDREVLDLAGMGSLRIETTQACTTMDIDAKDGPKEEVNLMAADLLARQVLWRDLRGMFVVDFITTGEENKRDLDQALRAAFKEDPLFIPYGFSKMGLYEFVRMRKEH